MNTKTQGGSGGGRSRKEFLRAHTGARIHTQKDKKLNGLGVNKTVIVISDVQVPWQDNDALDLALLVAKKCSPTHIVFNGDIWDVSGAASWRKNPFIPLLFNQERRQAREVYEIWDREFPDQEKYALPGNHEERISWALQSLPDRYRWIAQVADLDWASLLGLDCETMMAPVWEMDMDEREILELYKGWQSAGTGEVSLGDVLGMLNKIMLAVRQMPLKKFKPLHWHVLRREVPPARMPYEAWPSQGILQIGKLNFLHGHEIRMNSLAVHVAVNVLRKAKDNVLIGHWHRVGVSVDKNIQGRDIGVFLNPCLCSLEQYAFRPAWQQGLSIVDFTRSGYFSVQTVMFMRDDDVGLFGMLGRNVFRLADAPVKHRKIPPLGMWAQMLPAPKHEEML